MARAAKRSTLQTPQLVRIVYQLDELPTAQHKAGLAGMLLQIHSMNKHQRQQDPPPRIVEVTPTSATIEFTEPSVRALFDDLYDAEQVEVAVKAKWQGNPPKREEDIEETDADGKVRKSKRFIYDTVQPHGHFLRQCFPDGDGLWLKLWRNMLWEIPRGKPTTRIPFNMRAEKKSCAEGPNAWADLLAYEKARQKNSFKTAPVSSALLLGAQAANAEAVPFEGRVEQTLLLHFWPLAVMIFVPQMINGDGESEFVGYTLAIPEVSDVETFCEDYPGILRELGSQARGYRPAEAIIDLPEQSALEFMVHLAQLSQHRAAKSRIEYSVSSIDFMHLVKAGNNVKSMAAGRIAPQPQLLQQYLAICGRRDSPYRNPLFRSCLLLSLVQNRKWYEMFAVPLMQRPWPFFVRSDETPKAIPWFSADAGYKFEQILINHQQDLKGRVMTSQADEKPNAPLEALVYRLIQNYVNRKTEEKSGIKWDSFKDKKIIDEKSNKERVDTPQEYRDCRSKVASDAFLALRSRRDQDFVDYFAASICSVGQFLREEEFQTVAAALLRTPGDVKTLSLLALSANS